jgi:hypothetical protein
LKFCCLMDWNGFGPPQTLFSYNLNLIPTKNTLVIDMWQLNFCHRLNIILTIEMWQLNFGYHLYGQDFILFYISNFLATKIWLHHVHSNCNPIGDLNLEKNKSWSLRWGDEILVVILIFKVIEFFVNLECQDGDYHIFAIWIFFFFLIKI